MMPDIRSRPSERGVRAHFAENPDDVARDWELVLRESHHRMKNTLTLLGASVRRDFTRTGGRDMSVAVDRLEQRIVAFGRLYQLLSDNDDLTQISVEDFFENLCGAISQAVLEPADVRCEASIESGALPAWQCHRLALMLTELVTNAAKHAFPNKNSALIRIEMANREGCWFCTVTDNGVGATRPLQGTGSRILEGLARGIGARMHGEAGHAGTRVSIAMPLGPA